MTWLEKLHPRVPKDQPGGGEFIHAGGDWADRLLGGGGAATDRSEFDSGVDWRALEDALYRPHNGHGDAALAEIYDLQGFHAKPRVVTEAQLREQTRAGDMELWRGVSGLDRKETKGYATQYRTGETQYAGQGVFGNGTYSSPNWQEAVQYTGDQGGGRGQPGMLHLALHRDARTITDTEATRLWAAAVERAHEHADSPEAQRAVSAYEAVVMDPGRFAALAGYDALLIDLDDATPIVVILNRGKTSVVGTQWSGRQ